MNREDVTELHYITAMANLPSILQHGILSHTQATRVAHDSVAMPEIQERRRNKQIPGARPTRVRQSVFRRPQPDVEQMPRAERRDLRSAY